MGLRHEVPPPWAKSAVIITKCESAATKNSGRRMHWKDAGAEPFARAPPPEI
jgi:hypothetical protein